MSSSGEGDASSGWIVHGERALYQSRWVNLMLVDVELPDGQRFEHHVVRMQRVVAAAVVDDQDQVLLLWRHRFIPNSWGWELPAGIVDSGESPAHAAAREVEEETGWRPNRLARLIEFQPAIGIADTPHELFLGTDPVKVGEPTDVTEAGRLSWLPRAEIPALIEAGRVHDAPTLIGLLLLAHSIGPPPNGGSLVTPRAAESP